VLAVMISAVVIADLTTAKALPPIPVTWAIRCGREVPGHESGRWLSERWAVLRGSTSTDRSTTALRRLAGWWLPDLAGWAVVVGLVGYRQDPVWARADGAPFRSFALEFARSCCRD